MKFPFESCPNEKTETRISTQLERMFLICQICIDIFNCVRKNSGNKNMSMPIFFPGKWQATDS
jgi:hypothetical protein